MNSKKIISVIALTAVASSSFYFLTNKENVNKMLSSNINQNKVYTQCQITEETEHDSLKDTLGYYKIVGEDEEAYKEKSEDLLMKYFNVDEDDFGNMKFRVSRINERTCQQMEENAKEQIQQACDGNKISKDDYDDEMKYCDGGEKDAYAS